MKPNMQPSGPEAGRSILPFVVQPLPPGISDVRAQVVGRPHLTTVIYADAAGCSKPLAAGLSLLGRRSVVARTPLDAIRWLQDKAIAVDAVFASLQDDATNISALFEFTKDEHPFVRRIAFAQHNPRKQGALLVHLCQHEMIIWDPWDRADFLEILKDAIDCRISRTRSSWSDVRLFESQQGTDTLAVAEIVRRYRHRIVRLVMDATHETMDTEDVVQDTYLSIVRDLPSFNRVCAPGAWIDRITCRSILSFLNGKMNNTTLQSQHSERRHDSPRRSLG